MLVFYFIEKGIMHVAFFSLMHRADYVIPRQVSFIKKQTFLIAPLHPSRNFLCIYMHTDICMSLFLVDTNEDTHCIVLAVFT